MMTTFNLYQHLIKEAMGTQRMVNRDPLTYWTMDQIIAGTDPSWVEAVQSEPSLEDVVQDIRHQTARLKRDIRKVYGLPREQIEQVFKTYVGYHAAYGAYILSIGPYIGNAFPEAQGRLGYYTLRRRNITEQELIEATSDTIAKYAEKFNIQLEAKDLELVLKAPSGEPIDPESETDTRAPTKRIVERIDLGNESDRSRYINSPNKAIPCEGSGVQLKASGIAKLIRALYPQLLDAALAEASHEQNVDPARAELLMGNMDFLQSVYSKVQKKYKEAVKSGEAFIQGMAPPPAISQLSMGMKSGQQRFSTLSTNKFQAASMRIRVEVVDLMKGGMTDPEQIAAAINADPSRAAARRGGERVIVPVVEIEHIVTDINNRVAREGVDLNGLGEEFNSQISNLETQKGFGDLRTAYDTAKMYLASKLAPVDPKTGFKFMATTPSMIFDQETFVNVDSNQLAQWKEYKQQVATGQRRPEERPPQVHDAEDREVLGPQMGEEEIHSVLGRPEEPAPEVPAQGEFPITEVPVEEAEVPAETTQRTRRVRPSRPIKKKAPAKTPKRTPKKEVPPQPVMPEEEGIDNVLSNTINNLIKIARELDEEDKPLAAEEVHKVIRKYQRGK